MTNNENRVARDSYTLEVYSFCMNKHHMPDEKQAAKRPKCKVVRNMHEKHNGSARVAPKGCRIGKRVLTKGGPTRKVDKKGKPKPDKKKYKVAGDSFEVRADMPDGSKEWLVWDTGAMSTSVNQAAGIKLGLVDTDGKPTGKYKHGKVVVQTADKKQHNALILPSRKYHSGYEKQM